MNKRDFLKFTGLLSLSGVSSIKDLISFSDRGADKGTSYPLVVATWDNQKAVQAGWEILQKTGSVLNAVEAAAWVPEADPMDTSVGYGGFPDRDGHVTLDASIMDQNGNAGSVMFLEGFKHPISIARKVMELTPHVYLAGEGARQFALEQGFKEEDLLTAKAKEALEKWKIESKYEPKINIERHDTIGVLGQDKEGNLSGACTTSGLAFKMHGRVGDSPIIGSGLYVDNEIGAATATGLGEAVIKKVGAFSIVEMMRAGKSPQAACEEAILRLTKLDNAHSFQVGYLAVNKFGDVGAYSLQPGFLYAIARKSKVKLVESKSFYKNK